MAETQLRSLSLGAFSFKVCKMGYTGPLRAEGPEEFVSEVWNPQRLRKWLCSRKEEAIPGN